MLEVEGVGAVRMPPSLVVCEESVADAGVDVDVGVSAVVVVDVFLAERLLVVVVLSRSSCRFCNAISGTERGSNTMSFSHCSSRGFRTSNRGRWNAVVEGIRLNNVTSSMKASACDVRRLAGGGLCDGILVLGGHCPNNAAVTAMPSPILLL